MTDIFEQVITNGGTITEKRRVANMPNYNSIVAHVARQYAIAAWGGTFSLALLLEGLLLVATGNDDRLFWLLRPGAEWGINALIATTNAAIVWGYVTWAQLAKFRAEWTLPTERTITTQPQAPEPDVTRVMEFDNTIPLNSARLSTAVPRQRLGVHVAGYSLSGKRLDALQTHGLNRDAQGMTGTEYQRLTDALARAGLAQQVGRSWQWTEVGEAWIATAGLPHPDN